MGQMIAGFFAMALALREKEERERGNENGTECTEAGQETKKE